MRIFIFLFLILSSIFSSAEETKELKIVRVTPVGDNVPVQNQIVIQFNRAVVPLGDMQRKKEDIPVNISPELNCRWSWINTSSLACNLNEEDKLKYATKYDIKIKPEIKAEDGGKLDKEYSYQIITERPDAVYVSFHQWNSPSRPSFTVVFNIAVTKKSVEDSIYIVNSKNPDNKYKVIVQPEPNSQNKDKNSQVYWIVTPQKDLDENSTYQVKLNPGLVSEIGSEKGKGNRKIYQLTTFPEFSFLGVKCYTNEDDEKLVLIKPEDTEKRLLCNPMRGAALSFSSPVLRSVVKNNFIISPGFTNPNDENNPWTKLEDYSSLSQQYFEGRTYDIWIPAGIKAATTYNIETRKIEEEKSFSAWIDSLFKEKYQTNVKDEFGRSLKKPVNMSFKTNHRKPNFELIYNDAIIESKQDSDVPFYVTNLSEFSLKYNILTIDEDKKDLTSIVKVNDVQDIQFAVPLNIRKLLNGQSGVLYGSISTTPEIKKSPESRRLFVQVTPYSLQVKMGYFNSLVWVTDLATGTPVADAKVVIYKDKIDRLSNQQEILTQAITDKDGVALLDGTEKLDPILEKTYKWRDEDEKLIIRVIKNKDMAIMPLTYDFQIGSYSLLGESVYPRSEMQYGHMKAWGTTAQGIYRAGDIVDFKFYVRNQDNFTLVPAPKEGYKLEILDPTETVVYEENDIVLNQFGAYSGKYNIPKNGAIGWYSFRLTAKFALKNQHNQTTIWYPIKVLVSDFTPSSFKVENRVNGDVFKSGQEVSIVSEAKLYSGGAYSNANVRVTATLNRKDFISKNPIAKDFIFGSYKDHYFENQIFQKIDHLDNKGENKLSIKLPEEDIYFGRLLFESAVQDDRGKYYVATSYADYVSRDRYVGLKINDWLFEAGKSAKVNYIVADEKGTPVVGTKIDLKIYKEQKKVVKVKSAGNAYVPEYTTEWIHKSSCEGFSTKEAGTCNFTPNESGYYKIEAKILDTLGREHKSEIYNYVMGSGFVVWDEGRDRSLEIIPEKTQFKVGEKARYLIKNPYQGAKALITIERYGVIDKFVQTLNDSTAIIEFDVKPEYIPGFYLSVVLFSPRVEGALPEPGQIDLGKPSYKIGYITNKVIDKYKELVVTANIKNEIYKPRDLVHAKLHVEVKDKQEPIEFAVVVIDEAVFDLLANKENHFDPYNGFYQLNELDVKNYNLLGLIVGRQRFATKGANQGGDGGSNFAMRNIFKFVSYWNPSIVADKNGDAEIEFTVPDNLTNWKILVMAVTPTDRMGVGEVSFKVNQPTELRPVMPNQVYAGDKFEAGFSIMNRTDKKRDINVSIIAKGDLENISNTKLVERKISLEPYKRGIVWLPVEVKKLLETEKNGNITFIATANDNFDGDRLEHKLEVHQRSFLDNVASYGSLNGDKITEKFKIPKDINPNFGNISLELSPTILGNLAKSFSYMQKYPYSCWEQKLSKAVMAANYNNLPEHLRDNFSWPDANKFIEETLSSAANFQAPNGGMSYFVPQDKYVDPYLSAYSALAFTWLKSGGYMIAPNVEKKLEDYLDNLLRRNDFPSHYDQGMIASVRGMALFILAQNNRVSLADIERFRENASQMSLLGKNYLLEAMLKIEGADKYVPGLLEKILSYANQTSGKYIFSEELGEGYYRILSSNLRENCAILSSLTKLAADPKTKELVSDIPIKLVRSITDKAYWNNTQENVFCSNAIIDYASVFERKNSNIEVTSLYNDHLLGKADFSNKAKHSVKFIKKIEKADIGSEVNLSLSKKGEGIVYYNAKLSYLSLAKQQKSINSGIEIKREYNVMRDGKWELLSSPYILKNSDLVRVDIFLSVPAARNFVVVEDIVPGGLEPINKELATSSIIDSSDQEVKFADNSYGKKLANLTSYNGSLWSFYHKELRHDSVRFYSDYLPAGSYYLSYMAQAVAPGEFNILPISAQEMYNSDVYGKDVDEELKIER